MRIIIEDKVNFFEFHKKELGNSLRSANSVIFIDFVQLLEFSNKLADEIVSSPEEVLRLMELAIEESGLPVSEKGVRVRLYNLPDAHRLKIRNIRSKHLDELILIEG